MHNDAGFRTETDLLGEMQIPSEALWGIHTARAAANFQLSPYKVPHELIKALAIVKKSCCEANAELGYLPREISDPICFACDEIAAGQHLDSFITDALQGGAGTSTNMNMNEVLANRALELSGSEKGDYSRINPIDHANLHQSTNDVYPTALRIAFIEGFRSLSEAIATLQGALQAKEKEFASIVTIGRTELQPAVPIALGGIFSAFAEAIARDRWRTFKAEERLRTVNIGGTAVGTGLTAPRDYIFRVIEKLRANSSLGLMRAEQVMDATANADQIVEASGMLNALAVNLAKIAKDLRQLHFLGEIRLAPLQAGSSIMPGKVNPVVIEALIQISEKALANDKIVCSLAAGGTLQINEYLPMIGFAMLESLSMLRNAVAMFAGHAKLIEANAEMCRKRFDENEAIITAFLPAWGYKRCEQLIIEYRESGMASVREFLYSAAEREAVDRILSPSNLMALGYRE